MKSKCIGFLVLLLLIAANIGVTGYYYAVLPARVASKFDFSGVPVAWMPKGTFVIFNITLLVAMPAFLLIVAWISSKMPARMVSMPNRDYWLAPERKNETNAMIFRSILWLANGIELFLTSLVGISYWANLGHPRAMEKIPFVLLACFSLFMIGWLFCFYRKFRKVPQA